MLQLLYNAADLIVVGQFGSDNSLAAVGSTSALINLIINLLVGFSIGASVVVGNRFGAKDEEGVHKAVGSSLTVALIGGVFVGVIGIIFSPVFLTWMQSPENVIGLSSLYLRIYFIGCPFNMLYLFASGILRAVGDTKHPMIYLTISGIINVVLNLVLVIVFKLDVAGVAIATVVSQCFSAFFTVRLLVKSNSIVRFRMEYVNLEKNTLLTIIKIGLPAGIQGMVFSISNVIIQSSVNGFGTAVVNGVTCSAENVIAGNSASANIESFVYMGMNSVYQTALAFTSQNYGAGKIKSLRKIMGYCLGLVTAIGLIMGVGASMAGKFLCSIYSKNPEVIAVGSMRLMFVALPYCLCGMMDTMVGCLRGVGYSVFPMIGSMVGACGSRLLWIFTIFQTHHTLQMLYISYPISWGLTVTAHFITFMIVLHQINKRYDESLKQTI